MDGDGQRKEGTIPGQNSAGDAPSGEDFGELDMPESLEAQATRLQHELEIADLQRQLAEQRKATAAANASAAAIQASAPAVAAATIPAGSDAVMADAGEQQATSKGGAMPISARAAHAAAGDSGGRDSGGRMAPFDWVGRALATGLVSHAGTGKPATVFHSDIVESMRPFISLETALRYEPMPQQLHSRLSTGQRSMWFLCHGLLWHMAAEEPWSRGEPLRRAVQLEKWPNLQNRAGGDNSPLDKRKATPTPSEGAGSGKAPRGPAVRPYVDFKSLIGSCPGCGAALDIEALFAIAELRGVILFKQK